MAFGKLTAKLRKAKARTVKGLRTVVLAAFPLDERASFLRAAGYHTT
jgi:hypothetical protein